MKCCFSCFEQARWISVTENGERLLCQEHAEGVVFEGNLFKEACVVSLYRIDCEGPYVKTLLARINKEEVPDKEEYPELLRKG